MAYHTLNTKRFLYPSYKLDNEFNSRFKNKYRAVPKGYITMNDHCDLLTFPPTVSDDKTANKTIINDVQGTSAPGIEDFNDHDKTSSMTGFHSILETPHFLEGCSQASMKRLQKPTQADDYADSRIQEEVQPLRWLDAGSQDNIQGELVNDDGLHHPVFQSQKQVGHDIIERPQAGSRIAKTFKPNMKAYESSFYGMCPEESIFSHEIAVETNLFAPFSFNATFKKGFDLTLVNLANKKAKHQLLDNYQQPELTPVMDTTPSIEAFDQLEYDSFPHTIYGTPVGMQLERLFEGFEPELTFFPNTVAPQENVSPAPCKKEVKPKTARPTKKKSLETPLTEAQSDSSDCNYMVNLASYDTRPERNYVRALSAGLIEMVKRGKIGLFLDTWDGAKIKSKKVIIEALEIHFKKRTSEKVFKAVVFEEEEIELDQKITRSTSPELVFKIAKLKLLNEFIMKENYEFWAKDVFSPFVKGGDPKTQKEAKALKKKIFLDERVSLCNKFFKCFRNIHYDLAL